MLPKNILFLSKNLPKLLTFTKLPFPALATVKKTDFTIFKQLINWDPIWNHMPQCGKTFDNVTICQISRHFNPETRLYVFRLALLLVGYQGFERVWVKAYGIPTAFSRHSHSIPTAFSRHSNGIPTTFWRHSDGILTAFWRHSDGIPTTFWWHSNDILTAFLRH